MSAFKLVGILVTLVCVIIIALFAMVAVKFRDRSNKRD